MIRQRFVSPLFDSKVIVGCAGEIVQVLKEIKEPKESRSFFRLFLLE